MNKIRLFAALLAACFGIQTLEAETDAKYMGVLYSTKGDIVLGEWTSQFSKAMKYSEANDIPIVVFWGNTGCPHCVATEKAMATETFVNWQKTRGLVMVYTINSYNGPTGMSEQSAARKYAKNGTSVPYMAIYWKGHAISGSSSKVTLSMPDKSAQKVIDTIEKYVANYKYDMGSQFAVVEQGLHRYEADAATASVSVELVRETAAATLSEKLVVLAPDGKTTYATETVEWAVNELVKSVPVKIKAGTFSKDGEQLTVQVTSKAGEVRGTTHITYVEKGNSAANPDWIGETLSFGRWTADLDGAKQFAKDNGGSTLVSIQGSTWCPDCANTDRNFLDVEGGARIKKWAADNKVMLVAMDIPNYTGPSVTDRATPTLFTKEAYATTLARASEYPQSGAEASLTNAIVRSGLGYLSRKGVSDADAEKTLKKFHDLAYLNTDKGGFHRPEDGNKNRTGVPIFVLLRNDGSVAARFTTFASSSPMKADQAHFDNYVKRFEEMIVLAGADETEIVNNYPCAEDALVMAANGGELTSTLCNADFQDAVRLAYVSGQATQTLTLGGTAGAGVTVQFLRLLDGDVSTVGGLHRCDDLAVGATVTEKFDGSGEYFALVRGREVGSGWSVRPSDEYAATNENTVVTYTLTGSTVYVPGEAAQVGVAGVSGTARVVLEKGVCYCFTRLVADACAEWLEQTDLVYYTALKGGEAELAILGGKGTEFTYQIWKPGSVGFAKTERTVLESVNDLNDDYVEIEVERTGGSSGEVSVDVTLGAETDLYLYDVDPETGKPVRGEARFEFADPTHLVWPDGVSSNMIVRVKVLDESDKKDSRFNGDGKIVLRLGTLSGSGGDVGLTEGHEVFTLYVEELNEKLAVPGRVGFTETEPLSAKKQTVYMRANGSVRLYAAREDGSDGALGVQVKSSVADVEFSTANPRDLTEEDGKQILWWSHAETAEKYLCVSNVPAGKTAKITLSSYNKSKVNASSTYSVVSVAADAPYFITDDVEDTLYRYVAFSKAYAVGSTEGGKLTFAKLSGSLPAGLKVAYDEKAQAMVVSGVPTTSDTKTGVRAYEAFYQVTEVRTVDGSSRTTKVPGLVIRLAYTVVDPALAGGGEGGLEPLNAFFATSKARTYADIPLVNTTNGVLEGTLQVTIPRTGKASAKLLCALGTISFSSASFAAVDTDKGGLTLYLTSTARAYPNARLDVTALPNGSLDLVLSAPGIVFSGVYVPTFWSATDPAEAYAGSYVLAMPTNAVAETIERIAPSGSPYLTLKMTSKSQWNAGKMTWAGTLANGTAISGSAVLSEEHLFGGKVAHLPVVKQAKADYFSAFVKIGADGQVVSLPTVGDGVTARPCWEHAETASALSDVTWSVRYDLYGGIYEAPTNGAYKLSFDGPVESDQYGTMWTPETVPAMVFADGNVKLVGDNPDSVKISVSSGVVSGSFKLTYLDGVKEKTVSAAYKGVLVPGFAGRPMLQGAWTFKDKYRKTAINRGAAVIGE